MLYKRCQGKEALFGALVEDAGYYILRVLLILAGTALYGILYAKRLSLPHISAFHMLKNIRFSL